MENIGGTPEFYSYKAETNPTQVYEGLVQTIADQPKQQAAHDELQRKKNLEIAKNWDTSKLPEAQFLWQGEMAQKGKRLEELGTYLTMNKVDPFKTSDLSNPKTAGQIKEFHQLMNEVEQDSAMQKQFMPIYTQMRTDIATHSDDYKEGALEELDAKMKRPFRDVIQDGIPDISRLQKPYDVNGALSSAKNAITETQQGRTSFRTPEAIEGNLFSEWQNNPKAQKHWKDTYNALPNQERDKYAKTGLKNDVDPAYAYATDVYMKSLGSKKVMPYPIGASTKQSKEEKEASYRNEWVTGMLNSVPGTGEKLKAWVKSTPGYARELKIYTEGHGVKPGTIVIDIPTKNKPDKTVETEARKVIIDTNKPKEATIMLNNLADELTGKKVNIDEMLKKGSNSRISNSGVKKTNKTASSFSSSNKKTIGKAIVNPLITKKGR